MLNDGRSRWPNSLPTTPMKLWIWCRRPCLNLCDVTRLARGGVLLLRGGFSAHPQPRRIGLSLRLQSGGVVLSKNLGVELEVPSGVAFSGVADQDAAKLQGKIRLTRYKSSKNQKFHFPMLTSYQKIKPVMYFLVSNL